MSRTLIEDLQWDRSMVTGLDWKTYPILRFPDVPHISIDLIDRPTERPWGAGEPTAAVVAAAIANAIYDAVGVRIDEIPITPDKVLRALEMKKAGKAARVGPESFPQVPYPEPIFVLPPWEDGDGKETKRDAKAAVV